MSQSLFSTVAEINILKIVECQSIKTKGNAEQAVVICRARTERTQPMLPMGFGYVEGVTHDYKRHGTTTLFAALNVLNGAVLAACKPRHRHQEFLAFLREIDKAVPAGLDIHCIWDNYGTHSHPKIKA